MYEPFFYPLRWLEANNWSVVPRPVEVYRGTVRQVSLTELSLNLEVKPPELVLYPGRSTTLMIGFTCQPSSCPQLNGVVKGAKIEATFGSKLVSDDSDGNNFLNTLFGGRRRDHFMNELLRVRIMSEPEKFRAQALRVLGHLYENHPQAVTVFFDTITRNTLGCEACQSSALCMSMDLGKSMATRAVVCQ